MLKFLKKIKRKCLHLRLQPIRVFCFHQVSETFDASTMWECDWTQIDQFKQNIMRLKEQYEFISLIEATEKLKHDVFRTKKYAVLTADDGWASLKNILPWLSEHKIPITLFVNSAYIDGKHYQSRDTEKLLTKYDIINLINANPQYVTIASHGARHVDAYTMSDMQFVENVELAEEVLKKNKNKVNFFAFAYGHYRRDLLTVLKQRGLVPVLIDGEKNYGFDGVIHRECIDGINFK